MGATRSSRSRCYRGGSVPRAMPATQEEETTDEQADVAPPLPENPVSRLGDLWLCGNRRNQHRVLCADATTQEAVSRLLGDRKPFLMITDPRYGKALDREGAPPAGLNGWEPGGASYM